MTGISYVLFFLQQLDSIMPALINDKKLSAIVLACFLVPLALMMRSMKNISQLQVIAFVTLTISLMLLFYDSFARISLPKHDKHYTWVRWSGLPWFYGVSCFAFEGSALTLDIYTAMRHKKQDFNKALTLGLMTSTTFLMLTGIVMYHGRG